MKFFLLFLILLFFSCSDAVVQKDKPRLLITTDIGGDPDDTQSLIRLLVFSNEFEIEGLVASASGTPGELNRSVIRPDLIQSIVQAYGTVEASLKGHDEAFPTSEYLESIIKKGNPYRGWDYVGANHDTEGSEWIIHCVDSEDRKLNIAIWGGQTDLAQALWKVKKHRSEKEYRAFIAKLRIHDIADQDYIFENIWEEHPNLFYILNKAAEGTDKRNAVFRGMYLGGDEQLTSLDWLNQHIIENHGELGALYPQKTWTAPNPYGAMKEGDTPSWFYFLNNGLQDPEHPEYGGWGGRFIKNENGYFSDAMDSYEAVENGRATVWRWRPDFQNAFAARMDWCVENAEESNHPPRAIVNENQTDEIIILKESAGAKVQIEAGKSLDPDGDVLTYHWFTYPEAGKCTTVIDLNSKGASVNLTMPDLNSGEEAHIILKVTDQGNPPLSDYRRIILR